MGKKCQINPKILQQWKKICNFFQNICKLGITEIIRIKAIKIIEKKMEKNKKNCNIIKKFERFKKKCKSIEKNIKDLKKMQYLKKNC